MRGEGKGVYPRIGRRERDGGDEVSEGGGEGGTAEKQRVERKEQDDGED